MNRNHPEEGQYSVPTGWKPGEEADFAHSQSGGVRRRSRMERARQENGPDHQPLVYTEGSLYAPEYSAPVLNAHQSAAFSQTNQQLWQEKHSSRLHGHPQPVGHFQQSSSSRPDFSAGSPYGMQPGPYASGVPLPINQPPVQQTPTSRQHPDHAPMKQAAPVASGSFAAQQEKPPLRGSHQPQKQSHAASSPVSGSAGRGFLINRLLLVVCAVVFAVSAFLLIRYFANILITRRASVKMEEAYQAALENAATDVPFVEETPTPTPAPSVTPAPSLEKPVAAFQPTAAPSIRDLWPDKYPNNPMLRVSSVFYELQRQNPDIVGWLKIDGVLEEAVVQKDNEYYLTHNVLKQKSVTGALFLDEKCDLKAVPMQILIHGHNMKEGAMFGSLKKYKVKDASFYRAHPYIEFNTVYENSTYVIFAVAEVDLRWNKGDYLPFWENVRFRSVDDFMSYVHKARDLSHYRCNVDVQPGDRLLTLSTCTGNDDNKRLIVMARRLRDDENKLQLNMSIMSTYDR